jgi:hypothetical protein
MVAEKRDLAATRRFFTRALEHGPRPTDMSTDALITEMGRRFAVLGTLPTSVCPDGKLTTPQSAQGPAIRTRPRDGGVAGASTPVAPLVTASDQHGSGVDPQIPSIAKQLIFWPYAVYLRPILGV